MSSGVTLACPTCHDADHVAGCVARGVFDGVLYWECWGCGTRWHRFEEGHPRRAAAERAITAARS